MPSFSSITAARPRPRALMRRRRARASTTNFEAVRPPVDFDRGRRRQPCLDHPLARSRKVVGRPARRGREVELPIAGASPARERPRSRSSAKDRRRAAAAPAAAGPERRFDRGPGSECRIVRDGRSTSTPIPPSMAAPGMRDDMISRFPSRSPTSFPRKRESGSRSVRLAGKGPNSRCAGMTGRRARGKRRP